MKTLHDFDPRKRAMHLYFNGHRIARIAEILKEKAATIHSWKRRDKWDEITPVERVEMTLEMRLCTLISKENKEGKDFKEIDLLYRQVERHAKIHKYQNGGNEVDLNPKLANRNKGERRALRRIYLAKSRLKSWKKSFVKICLSIRKHGTAPAISTEFATS